MANSKFNNYTTSFSGSDMIVMFLFPGAAPVTTTTASTIAYSMFRQLAQHRTLGRQSAKGYARGGVTFAGSIVFTVVKQSFIEDIKAAIPYLAEFGNLRPDELPPFDILVTFANELGQTATLAIYGVSFTDETKTFSVEDIFTENVLTFIARDIRHMKAGESFMPGSSSASFRAADEEVGKFTVSELYASIETAEREKRLEEIRKAMQDRVKLAIEQPARQPEVVKDPVLAAQKATLQISVLDDRKGSGILGATVAITNLSDNSKHTSTTNASGFAYFKGLATGGAVTFSVEHKSYMKLNGTSDTLTPGGYHTKVARMVTNAASSVPDHKPTKMTVFAPYDKAAQHWLDVSWSRTKAGFFNDSANNKPTVQLSNDANGYNVVGSCNTQWSWKITPPLREDQKYVFDVWNARAKVALSGSFAAQLSNASGNVVLNDGGKFKGLPPGTALKLTARVVADASINKSVNLMVTKD